MVTCATDVAFRPGRLSTQLRQVPTLHFVWSKCIIRGSGTTLACRTRSFSHEAGTAFMVRTILASAPQYLMGAFVSPFHTQPLSTNSSGRYAWRKQRISSVDAVLQYTE